MLEHKAEDVHVRHTDKDGNVHVEAHRVWNRDLFLKSLARAAVEVGGLSKKEAITREQYIEERGGKPTPKRKRK